MISSSNPAYFLSVLLGMCAALAGQTLSSSVGAPPPGSGSATPAGPIRVIDGTTLDVVIGGHQVAVGLIGLKAPEGNTRCGMQAIQAMGILVQSGLRLDEDVRFPFDSRKRRMYYARNPKNGRSLAADMIGTGYAEAASISDLQSEFDGDEDTQLRSAEADAKSGKRGCLWGGSPMGPRYDDRLLAAAGLSRAELEQAEKEESTDKSDGTSDAKGSKRQAAAPMQPRVSVPAGFSIQTLVSGLTNPTGITFLPDGRILIALKAGIVKIYKPGSGLLASPFID